MAVCRLFSSCLHAGNTSHYVASSVAAVNCAPILTDTRKMACSKFCNKYWDRKYSVVAGYHHGGASVSHATWCSPRGTSCMTRFVQRYSTVEDKGSSDITSSGGKPNGTVMDSDYKLVYEFSRVKEMRAVSQLKIYQTIVVVMATPVVFQMCKAGMLTVMEAGAMTGFAVLAAVMLGVMSNFFRKVVGKMYISTDGTSIKVSHLTFWSRRRNMHLDITDIVPLSDSAQRHSNAYVCLDTYSKTGKFYMFLAFGGHIVDKEALQKVLGLF